MFVLDQASNHMSFQFSVLKVKQDKVGQGLLEEDRAHCGSKNDVKLPPASLPVSFSFLLPKLAIGGEIVFKSAC